MRPQLTAPVFNLAAIDAYPFYEALYGVQGSPIHGGIADPIHRLSVGRPVLSTREALKENQQGLSNIRARMLASYAFPGKQKEKPSKQETPKKPKQSKISPNVLANLVENLYKSMFPGVA